MVDLSFQTHVESTVFVSLISVPKICRFWHRDPIFHR